MSSQSEQDLSCLVCHDVFKDPVVLTCSHSFCKDCLKNWWREKPVGKCPVCQERLSKSNPPCKLCKTLLLERDLGASATSVALCSLHSEEFKLFCLDHLQPVCVVCLHSETHRKHRFRPIKEAAQDLKAELQKSLKPLREKGKIFKEIKGNFDQTAKHIKVQARLTEEQIKEQFEKLHQFLQEEEEARISALREEEELKSKLMREKIEVLSDEIAALSETIKTTEEELKTDNVSFLQSYKAAKKRVQQRPLLDDPQLHSGALIDEAKHLGNLSFNIWSKMKDLVSYSPVILDPSSAHPRLLLSGDLTSVRHGERQKLPENPERIDTYPCVLGSEGFDSGCHTWDVEVTNDEFWGFGVIQGSVPRKGPILTGYWEICLRDGKYTAVSPPLLDKALLVKELRRIRVQLDFEKGKLSFWDLDAQTLIHTVKHAFTDRLFPCFGTRNTLPLQILPGRVTMEQHSVSTGFWPGL